MKQIKKAQKEKEKEEADKQREEDEKQREEEYKQREKTRIAELEKEGLRLMKYEYKTIINKSKSEIVAKVEISKPKYPVFTAKVKLEPYVPSIKKDKSKSIGQMPTHINGYRIGPTSSE